MKLTKVFKGWGGGVKGVFSISLSMLVFKCIVRGCVVKEIIV